MTLLCDPDIDMLTVDGWGHPIPSVRQLIMDEFRAHGFTHEESIEMTKSYLNQHNEICLNSLTSKKSSSHDK